MVGFVSQIVIEIKGWVLNIGQNEHIRCRNKVLKMMGLVLGEGKRIDGNGFAMELVLIEIDATISHEI